MREAMGDLDQTLRGMKSLSRVQLFAIPWTAAYQAPPSMGFSTQEYWSGVPLRGWQCPFVLCLHPHYLQIDVWASRSYQERIRKSWSFGMWHHHRGYVSNFLVRQPHLRCVEKVGNPLQTKQGN